MAVAGLLAVIAEHMNVGISESEMQMIVLALSSWIIGDSIRKTEQKPPKFSI